MDMGGIVSPNRWAWRLDDMEGFDGEFTRAARGATMFICPRLCLSMLFRKTVFRAAFSPSAFVRHSTARWSGDNIMR